MNKRNVWQLYLTATKTGQRPSRLVEISDKWAAYQFDNAVVWVGIVLENAAQEMHNVGSEKAAKWEPKYTMQQLLDDKFRLPPQPTQLDSERASIAALRSMARKAK